MSDFIERFQWLASATLKDPDEWTTENRPYSYLCVDACGRIIGANGHVAHIIEQNDETPVVGIEPGLYPLGTSVEVSNEYSYPSVKPMYDTVEVSEPLRIGWYDFTSWQELGVKEVTLGVANGVFYIVAIHGGNYQNGAALYMLSYVGPMNFTPMTVNLEYLANMLALEGPATLTQVAVKPGAPSMLRVVWEDQPARAYLVPMNKPHPGHVSFAEWVTVRAEEVARM